MPIIDKAYIRSQILSNERFASSHGANLQGGHLGLGMLYYALAYTHPSLCVCLGSGSGFVPRLMRQAQCDIGYPAAQTYLVDADLPELGYGTTDYFHGELGAFTRLYPDIKVLKMKSHDAATMFKDIDYLHIDADHSYYGTKSDLEDYLPRVAQGGVVTIHDTINRAENLGVWKALRELRAEKAWELVEFRQGMGTALLKRRMSDE